MTPTYEDTKDGGPCRHCREPIVVHDGPLGPTYIHRYGGHYCRGNYLTEAAPMPPLPDHTYHHKRKA